MPAERKKRLTPLAHEVAAIDQNKCARFDLRQERRNTERERERESERMRIVRIVTLASVFRCDRSTFTYARRRGRRSLWAFLVFLVFLGVAERELYTQS